MDIHHALSRNPLRPPYGELPWRDRSPVGRTPAGSTTTAGSSRSGTMATASRSTTRGPATTCCCARSGSPDRLSPAVTGWRSWPTAATAARICGCPTAGPRSRRTAGRRRCTGSAAAATWEAFRLDGLQPVDPRRAGRPRQLLRGRRLRPVGGRPLADGGRVGDRRAGAGRSRRRLAVGTARSGSGRPARTSRTPGSARLPARSASTTASSWSTSTCCAAAAGRRHRATPGGPTATSSRRTPAGPSAAFGWQGTDTPDSERIAVCYRQLGCRGLFRPLARGQIERGQACSGADAPGRSA